MLTLYPDIPSEFGTLIDASEGFGGELIIFRPDDVIACVSPLVPARYAFCTFIQDLTYTDLYWGAITHGLVRTDDLRLSPEDYFHLALGVRRTNDILDFQKPYRDTRFLCHHRRLPNGWTAQLRLDLGLLRLSGDAPLSVFDAIERTRETARLEAALNTLSVGVLFTDICGRVRWTNSAADDFIASSDGFCEHERHLVFADHASGVTFFRAVESVLAGGGATFFSLPHHGRSQLLSVMAAPFAGEVMVLIAPADQTDTNVDHALASLGLSRAERRIAASIGRGESPQEIGASTDIAVTTVRRHLANTYRKLSFDMDVTSQRDLVRLVGQVASIAGFSRKFSQ